MLIIYHCRIELLATNAWSNRNMKINVNQSKIGISSNFLDISARGLKNN